LKTQKDLSPQQKQAWLKAMSAMELKNYPYVIQLTRGLVQALPEFLDGRILLRKAVFEKEKASRKGFFSLGGAGLSLKMIKASSLMKRGDLPALLLLLEEILEEDPGNIQANTLLSEAALRWDPPMEDLAMFAFETILEANPSDKEQLSRFASFCMEKNSEGSPRDPARAIEIYNRIIEISPNDLAAIKGGKDAAAAHSVQQGGWEKAESYRDLIKDKDEATLLEQANRVVKSEEMIDNQIAELAAAVQAEPANIDKSRRVAELYEQKGACDQAIEWYRYVHGLGGGGDATIAKKIADLQLRQINDAYRAREERLAEAPDDPEALRYRQEMEELVRQRMEFILGEARDRVQRNPTDLLAHFDLASALMEAGLHQEAIGHLQRSRNNPSVRLKAMNKLGQCYVSRGMNDLAAKTFTDAISEIPGMDAVKKDLLYNLGCVYETMSDREEAISCFKQIYEVDCGYRDVATKVESSYSQG
jgi:tetratricopeptide (TPR) repeat protein